MEDRLSIAEEALTVERGAHVRVNCKVAQTGLTVLVLDRSATVSRAVVNAGRSAELVGPAGRCTLRALVGEVPEKIDLELDLRAGETRAVVFDGAWK